MQIPFPARSIILSGILALAALFAATSLGGGAAPAYALTNCTVSDNTFDSEEQYFLKLINDYRKSKGVGALTASTNLNRASSWMAADMATKNYFSHTDSSGRSSSTRMKDCGATVPGSGENIAAGTVRDTAQEVFDAWKASSGHNENMLRSTFKQIGIARAYNGSSTYKWYWVTDFSTTTDGTNAGGCTTTPPPPAAPIESKAVMTSPTPGSTLSSSSVTFRWGSVSAQEYKLDIGTSVGGTNLYSRSRGTSTSAYVSGLPHDGRTLYVRLWTKKSGVWQYNDYIYQANRR